MSNVYGILNTARTALSTQQNAIDVAGHNIANVNTPGYTRQRVMMTPALPFDTIKGPVGAGVDVASIEAVRDHFLMNNKGLFIGNSGGGGSPRPEDDSFGLSWSNSLPYLARFADTAKKAKEMITAWQINIPENFHFVDVHGGGFVVEKTAAVQAVRKPGDFGERDFLYSTNNYLHEKMQVTKKGGFIKQHGGYGSYAAPRNTVRPWAQAAAINRAGNSSIANGTWSTGISIPCSGAWRDAS